MILLWLACSPSEPPGPLDDIKRAEAVFYDAERLAREAQLPLVPVVDGEPLQHTIRVVVRPDGVDVDNRAWWLATRSGTDPERQDLVVRTQVVAPASLGDVHPMDSPLTEALSAIADRLPEREPGGPGRTYQILAHADTPADQVKAVIQAASMAGFGRYQLVGRVGNAPRAVLASRPPPFERKPCAVHLAHWTGPDRGHWLDTTYRYALLAGDEPLEPAEVVPLAREVHDRCVPIWDRAEQTLAGSPYLPEAPRSWRCVSVGNSLPEGVPIARVYPVMAEGYAAWPEIVAMGVYGVLNFSRFEDPQRLDALEPDALERLCLGPLALLTRPDDEEVRRSFRLYQRRRLPDGTREETYRPPNPWMLHKLLGTRPKDSE